MKVHEDIFLLSLLFKGAEEVFLRGKNAQVVKLIYICKGLKEIGKRRW
jgi:hypothetical protein